MLDKKNIITTLIAQHRTLQKEVDAVTDLLTEAKPDSHKIDQGLRQFTKDLAEHLDLENNIFYVELLKEMKASGQDISKTEKFIAEMKDIEKVVLAFLGKYKDAGSIENDIDGFKKEFAHIAQTLTLRIESEEAGVYTYWEF